MKKFFALLLAVVMMMAMTAGALAEDVTLRVWECNPGARAFYEAMGFVPYATNMERIIGG